MWIRVADTPIDVNALLESVHQRGQGAQLLFVGTVRDVNQGRSVVGIRYEAYREMAESVLLQIVTEAQRDRADLQIAVEHRTGDLEVGEASVAIAVSAPHRAEAFEATRYIIEEIKKRLPVWKQEKFADGGAAWLNGINPMSGVPGDE
jgi:molybdopterin synthase catalytic subunit